MVNEPLLTMDEVLAYLRINLRTVYRSFTPRRALITERSLPPLVAWQCRVAVEAGGCRLRGRYAR